MIDRGAVSWAPSGVIPQILSQEIHNGYTNTIVIGLGMIFKHPLIRLITILAIVSGILLIVPVKIPFSISSHAQIFHGKEWVLTKDQGGRISASLYDRINGRTENYRLHQFERQDAVRFELNNTIVPGSFVKQGDTVGHISSAQLRRDLVTLSGDLQVTRASLDLYKTGEKEAVIEEARNRLAYAKQQVEGHSILLERTKELHNRNLISDEELDIAVQQNRLYEIDILIAEAQLQSALTGAKDEQITYLETRIATLEEEIRSLQQTIDDYTYLSPIDGIVYHTFSHDTLALIGDPEYYLAVIPVSFNYRPYISVDQEVELRIPGNNIVKRNAQIRSIGNTVRVMNGGQYFIINAVLENDGADDEYLPGILASASIKTEPVTMREYFLRYIRPIFN